jgi:hypothetical protein
MDTNPQTTKFRIKIHPHCKRKINPYQEMTGRVFGWLTVIEEANTHRSPCGSRRIQWLCQCVCGNIRIVRGDHLRTRNTTSCGCIANYPTKHGMCGTPEYLAYMNCRARCTHHNQPYSKHYVDAGVEFRFASFEEFFKELGSRPSPELSVDRINPFGHYERGNVRWATYKVQANNTRKKFLGNATTEDASLAAILS